MTDQLAREARRRGDLLPQPLYVSKSAVDRMVAEVPVRVFASEDPCGVFLHLHGGGFVFGSARLQDARLERLSTACRLTVLSVEYRLAPEHPHPAAVDDCESVAVWLARSAANEFGTDRLAIGGESAGANLAVTTLVRLRDRRDCTGFTAAVLSAGLYDLELAGFAETTDGSIVREELDQLAADYAGGATRSDPDLSPMHADLHGLPEALFTVGSLDPIRPDSTRMAARWRAAGNEARLEVIAGGGHDLDASEVIRPFISDRFRRA